LLRPPLAEMAPTSISKLKESLARCGLEKGQPA